MNSNLFISKRNNRFVYKQLNSKFYGYLYSVSSIDDIKKHLNQLKEKYPDCSHICYSYRLFNGFNLLKDINISEFSNDDGEPRGSAGPPILKILKRYDMINTVIFIVRYFGGKKLWISLSPNKTWSGFIFGILGGTLTSVVCFYINYPIASQNNINKVTVPNVLTAGGLRLLT